ncbi:MAG: bifunctional 4-hydroxy-2-oxoglutarate aldolase/2-dehydro-3-deoxy-phosphogluconate aldolase [Chitinivibrionales bacterium]|nr:bifunctional 4-hydroxy-2-oxoglutarate aldolase/2-dehydro-3-deoxy-phosphogluconate aldolase [Chitinivibrionales bacterium]
MTAADTLAAIAQIKVVPVGVIDDPDDAPRVAEALIEGGLGCFEVVFRTSRAAEAIGRMSRVQGILAGAGTVLTVDQVKQAVDNGASFIVSPGVDTEVLDYCAEHDICTLPGVATATEIQTCLRRNITAVKFFPSAALGGVPMINALGAPFPQVRFVPTGGVSAANLAEYLACPKVLACGGSWLAKAELVREKRFDEIARRAREAVVIAGAGAE